MAELDDHLVHDRHDCTCKERICLVAFFWDITEPGMDVYSKAVKGELPALIFLAFCADVCIISGIRRIHFLFKGTLKAPLMIRF